MERSINNFSALDTCPDSAFGIIPPISGVSLAAPFSFPSFQAASTTCRIVCIDPLAIDLNADSHIDAVAANGFDGAPFDHDGAGTRAAQHALINELLLDWAKTDPRYSEALVKMMSSITYDPNSTNIIYLRPGQDLPAYVTNAVYPDASIDVQHHVRILDAIRGDRVTTVLNEASAQESSAVINTAYTALADAVYDALLSQTRLRPYLDAIALSFDENGLRFDLGTVQQLLATRYAVDPAGTLAESSTGATGGGSIYVGTANESNTCTAANEILYQRRKPRTHGGKRAIVKHASLRSPIVAKLQGREHEAHL